MRPDLGRICCVRQGKGKEKTAHFNETSGFDGGDGEDRTLDLHTASVYSLLKDATE